MERASDQDQRDSILFEELDVLAEGDEREENKEQNGDSDQRHQKQGEGLGKLALGRRHGDRRRLGRNGLHQEKQQTKKNHERTGKQERGGLRYRRRTDQADGQRRIPDLLVLHPYLGTLGQRQRTLLGSHRAIPSKSHAVFYLEARPTKISDRRPVADEQVLIRLKRDRLKRLGVVSQRN